MSNKIALFTTINKNYVKNAIRCFQIFKENNNGIFNCYIVTSDNVESYQKELDKNNIGVINIDLSDVFKIDQRFEGYPTEMYWYHWVPLELNRRGYKFSMYVDADTVNMKPLDFSWLNTDDFVLAGAPRMRDDLSEKISAWFYVQAFSSHEKRIFLHREFELINKEDIIDIHSGILIFNNSKWVLEKMYEKSLEVFNGTKYGGHPMVDDDSLLALLLIVTPNRFYKHLSPSWNWYYEDFRKESNGGKDVDILHMVSLKPWSTHVNKNHLLEKGRKIWSRSSIDSAK
jgi:lipopolysaccharide biosynthesis glycosyltransferase